MASTAVTLASSVSCARRLVSRLPWKPISVDCCVAPKLFLPISRALVLFAPWSGQERWAHALAASPLLDGLDVSLGRLDSADDVVVLEPDWTELPPAQAPTFERARCPARLSDLLGASAFDLVVLPRALAFDRAAPRAAAHAILRSRLPVLIC